MSGTLFSVPKFSPVNSSGRPYASATLTFTRAGTSTALAVYSDAALTTGVGTNGVVTANSAGLFPAIYLSPTYAARAILKNSAGSTLWTEDNIPTEPGLTQASIGAALYPRTAAEISASVTPVNYAIAPGNVLRYGTNTSPGTTDMTAAITAAANVVRTQGGGTVIIPAGNYGVTSVVAAWATSVSVNFEGEGSKATYLTKLSGTTTPVVSLSSDPLGDGNYSLLRGFSVVGYLKGGHGIQLTTMARVQLRDICVSACDVGIDAVGALIFTVDHCDLNSNNIGFRTRKGSGPYCNLVEVKSGGIRGNTTHGLDIGDSGGLSIANVDIESNGTAADTATGGMILRSTNGAEFSYAIASLKDVWLESNYGTTIATENCTALMLAIKDTVILSAEDGLAVTSLGLKNCTLDNVIAASSGDTVAITSGYTTVRNSVINVLTDSSTLYDYTNLTTGAATYHRKSGSSTLGAHSVYGSKVSSGSGSAATTSGAAADLFTPAIKGMYMVYAYVIDAGSGYTSNALVAFDGTNAVRMGGDNAASLSLAIGTGKVQATQTSGAPQTVQYVYELVAA